MKRAAAALVFIAAVSTVGIGIANAGGGGGMTPAAMQYSAKPPPNAFPNADTVFGGGHFTAFGSLSHNFSVTATGNSGTLVYNAGEIVGSISCLNVTGNIAVVGGTIVSSSNANFVGDVFNMYFEDNGQPSGTNVGGDDVSPIAIVGPGTAPKNCPDATLANFPEVDAVDAGDVTVHAKGS